MPAVTSRPNSNLSSPSSRYNRDKYGDIFSQTRRAILLLTALLFVVGSAVLSLNLRAVPKTELAVVALAVLYVLAASTLQPPHTSSSKDRIKPLARDRQLSRIAVRIFLISSFLISIAAPWIWLTCFRTTLSQRRLLGPHLFLMMAQVLFEIWSYRTTVSLLLRITIPVAFVSYRIRLLVDWVKKSSFIILTNSQAKSNLADRLMFALAMVNLVFWGIILFYVLLLKVCPPYFLENKLVSKKDVNKKM